MAVSIPKDGVVVVDTTGYRYVMYQPSPGMFITFDLAGDFDTSGMEEIARHFNGIDLLALPNVINSNRNAQEIQGLVGQWGSFGNWYNHLMTTFVRNPDARADKGVQKLIMEMSFRPDMSQAEFESRMRQTSYWQSRNDAQRDWNDQSPAEQAARTGDMAARIADEYFQAVGAVLSSGDPQIQEWARQVASGNMGYGAVVDAIRGIARRNPESPWSRTVRNEEENQRQRGQDIADMRGRLQQMANDWGVRLTNDVLSGRAKRVVENYESEADFLEYLKDQSQILYPQKDREVSARDYGQAWIATFERVLERPDVSIFNPDIQKAMQGNVPLADFERELKKRPEWLNTGNAFDEINRNVGTIGQTMGFI